MNKLFSLSALALALFLLAACGGGGGSVSAPNTTNDGGNTAPDTNNGGHLFPRDAPTAPILTSPDNSDYTSRKSLAEAFPQYEPNYTVSGTNRTDSHLRQINAAAAYARGATGAGQTIAIIDTGIRDTHQEFFGSSGSSKVVKETQAGYSPNNDDKFHGTLVAALAVGNRGSESGLNMHGVAFDAKLSFREIELGASDGVSRPVDLEDPASMPNQNDTRDRNFATFFDSIIKFAKTTNAAIANMSFGLSGVISSYTREEIRNSFVRTAATLAQAKTLDADKTILVWAAGNAGSLRLPDGNPAPKDSPEILSGLGVYFPELQSHVIAVVALDQDGSIAGYSSRCGIAKSYCLAAPGSNLLSALSSSDTSYRTASGTSLAAPLVSGSLALLRQYFRGQLGNTELVNRLLATANRTGIYAESDIYGHGLVDLDAATAPVGVVMTGLPGDPSSRPFAGSGIALSSGAFGASLQGALADVEVAGFDALGAPFFQSVATWARPPQERSGIERGARKLSLLAPNHTGQSNGVGLSLTTKGNAITDVRLAFANGWWVSYGQHGGQSLGLYEQSLGNPLVGGQNNTDGVAEERFHNPLAFAAPYLSLVRDGAGIGWSRASSGDGSRRFGFALMHGASRFEQQDDSGGKRGIGILLSMTMNRKQAATGLSLQVGAVRESDGFLGVRTQGVFGKAHAATAFVGINGAWALGNEDNWHLLASAYLGRTRPQIDDNGLLHNASTIISSAFSIGTARTSIWQPDDWLGLRLSQPLRAESGEARLRVPAGRTKYGKVVYQNYNVSLVPTGRTIHAAAIYRLPIAGGALETQIGMARHPQHHSAHDIRPFMRLAFERRF